MAINKISAPGSTFSSASDWSAVVNQLAQFVLDKEQPNRINYSSSLVLRGSIFNIGGSLYLADADTSISGTASQFVKLTPSGSTATASFVSSLSGVSWNSSYKGYYDSSGNLYLSPLLEPHGIAIFTSSGSFLVPHGVTSLYITGCGGGGNGGNGAGGESSYVGGGGGGGGGSGAWCEKKAISVVPGTSYTITVGVATTSSFGALLSLPAGGNGGNGSGSSGGSAGSAGSGASPDIIVGAVGGSGSPSAGGLFGGTGAQGASSPWKYPAPGGNGGPGADAGHQGATSGGYGQAYGSGGGGGGGGAGTNYTGYSTGASGGAGMTGILIIEW